MPLTDEECTECDNPVHSDGLLDGEHVMGCGASFPEHLEESGMSTDIRVDRHRNHSREFSIYDRLGGAGNISLTVEEAKFVRSGIGEELDIHDLSCPYCPWNGALDGLGSEGEEKYRHRCPDCGGEFITVEDDG